MERNDKEDPQEVTASDYEMFLGEDDDTSSEMTALFVYEPHPDDPLPPPLDIAHAKNLIPSPWCSDAGHEDSSALPVGDDNDNNEVPDPSARHEECSITSEPDRSQDGTGSEPDDDQYMEEPGEIRQPSAMERLYIDEEKEQDIEEWLDDQPHWPYGQIQTSNPN